MKSHCVQYGCLFCITGSEMEIAHRLCDKSICLNATSVYRIEHRYKGGIKVQVKAIALPGYVFFAADESFAAHRLQSVTGVIRLLADIENNWVLQGGDYLFAKWVFENNGMIGISKAIQVGSRIRILSGPMKDYEGSIIKIDRHARSGIVSINFNRVVLNLRLTFEIV